MKEVKKLLFIFICFALTSSQINFIVAQDDIIEDIPGSELINKFAEDNNYLIREWKNIIFQNPAVVKIDSFLQKISFIFVFFFGEPYSLSITLWLVIILWFYFFFNFIKVLKNHTPFPKYICIIVSFALVVILAQMQSLHGIAERIIWFVVSREASIWRWISVLGIILILIGISFLLNKLGAIIEDSKEKKAKQKEKFNRKILEAYTQDFIDASDN